MRAQWVKWRMPVKTIAIPCCSAAAMTSGSRSEPPGWMQAVAPASATTSRPSLNGKKASDAQTVPLGGRGEDDGVGLDMLGHAPGEAQGLKLPRRRGPLRDHRERRGVEVRQVRLLDPETTGHRAERPFRGGVVERHLQDPELLLRPLDLLQGLRRVPRREEDLQKNP